LASDDYFRILEQIRCLQADSEPEERPSGRAVHLAQEVLSKAARFVGLCFPAGVAAAGPDNGLRFMWHSHPREVRLICGGGERNRSYIYAEEGGVHEVEHVVSGEKLAGFLWWLQASR